MSHDFEGLCENGWEGVMEAIECDVDLGAWETLVALRCCCG
jgi:hypothetical protein